MSVVSVNTPGNIGISVSGSPVGIPPHEKSPNELDGGKVSMTKADAVEKCLGPISENTRNQFCTCPDLSAFPNSEYVYAIYPIAIALFWD